MANRGDSPGQLIGKLREAEALMSKGMTATQALGEIGISEHTYYRWGKKYGGTRATKTRSISCESGAKTGAPCA